MTPPVTFFYTNKKDWRGGQPRMPTLAGPGLSGERAPRVGCYSGKRGAGASLPPDGFTTMVLG